MAFPQTRMRRLRRSPALRDLVRETRLDPRDFVLPMFVKDGLDDPSGREPVPTLPGVDRHSISSLVRAADEVVAAGIPAVMLFGIPRAKDDQGSGAWDDDGIIQLATKALKDAHPELVVMTDLCLCGFADHGHCGVLSSDGTAIDNDASLEIFARAAVSQARAGSDMISPSAMMDGTVGAIRSALDEEGFATTPILAYSAKFASAYYGPFRDAAASAPAFGDRRTYQMDPGNVSEALREGALDVAEGADAVMVKPALAYLDVIARFKREINLPLAAYNVSGEYAMVKAGAAAGALDERTLTLETLTAIKRAGADLIITYHALEAARWLA